MYIYVFMYNSVFVIVFTNAYTRLEPDESDIYFVYFQYIGLHLPIATVSKLQSRRPLKYSAYRPSARTL